MIFRPLRVSNILIDACSPFVSYTSSYYREKFYKGGPKMLVGSHEFYESLGTAKSTSRSYF